MKHRGILCGALVLASFLLLGPTALAGGMLFVNGISGSDSNNCLSPTTACKTIGRAISIALSGDTISVAAATYSENLTVSKNLTISGAGASTTIVDGGGRAAVVIIPGGVNLTLTALTVQNGSNAFGGGIANEGNLNLKQARVVNSSGAFGGGIFSDASLTVNNSTISGNRATSDGGGIYNTGALTVVKSAVRGNNAFGSGGGIDVAAGMLQVTRSTISGNTANDGGGIMNGGTLTSTNSTISGNSAPTTGGGLENTTGATAALNNTTLSGNTSSLGGGIYTFGLVTVQNTIVANSPSGGSCFLNGGIVTSDGFNLSSDGTCPFHSTGDLDNTNPLLGPLQNNGGPTQTQALLAGSPAIDAGNPGGCRDGNGNLLKTDQRGKPRPDAEDAGIGCDMGAYELQNAP